MGWVRGRAHHCDRLVNSVRKGGSGVEHRQSQSASGSRGKQSTIREDSPERVRPQVHIQTSHRGLLRLERNLSLLVGHYRVGRKRLLALLALSNSTPGVRHLACSSATPYRKQTQLTSIPTSSPQRNTYDPQLRVVKLDEEHLPQDRVLSVGFRFDGVPLLEPRVKVGIDATDVGEGVVVDSAVEGLEVVVDTGLRSEEEAKEVRTGYEEG